MTHKARWRRMARRLLRAAAPALLPAAGALTGPAALALDEQKGEAAAIEACDRQLCSILVGKSLQGPDLQCKLTKTWAKSTIKEADTQKVSWGFGDARCSVDINIPRARLVEAMTGQHATLRPGRLTADCVVEEGGKLQKVTAVVSPKIEFRNGKAEKVWVRLKKVDGPASITLTLQTAAQLADTFGLFHSQMLRNIDRYIGRHCPKALQADDKTALKAKAPNAKDKAAN